MRERGGHPLPQRAISHQYIEKRSAGDSLPTPRDVDAERRPTRVAIQRATASIRERHRYHFFASFPGSWWLHSGPGSGVVAVLQELGVSGPRASESEEL